MGEQAIEYGDGTRVVHAGIPAPVDGQPLRPGPVFAAPYHLSGDPASTPYGYGRDANPTWTWYERALEELEGGPVVVFASGMAAISAVLFTVLRPGDAVDAQGALLDGARLLWLETPSNPGLEVCDIRRLADAAHAVGALVAVDNTTATPLGQRPLQLGADFSVASDTKALTGHSDLLLGHVAARDPQWAARVRRWRKLTGGVPGPMETWLAHRSLATLDVRLERQCASARAIAEWLLGRPEVRHVRYPGLPTDPSYEVAAKQMRRFGFLIGFELPDAARAEAFLAACRLVGTATSFGGVHTTAERRARWGGDAVPEGFVRLSVGCENTEDLIADLAQALG
ncbi:cystathionine gamma-lyase [Carbonactinospora thermoautotrophica]|uniref:cystathionine gamma-lyase n=1 Tax=Carbonactinospora thermoautotrophica TaxID=1469144 RepID=UPI003DA99A4F